MIESLGRATAYAIILCGAVAIGWAVTHWPKKRRRK